jgi:mono/diheme cytochrome c family protein
MHRGGVSILLLLLSSSIAAVSRSVWDGVYTKQQAGRGQSAYREECLKCHAENLMGGEAAPALAGDEFLHKWNGKTAGDLFELIRKTMPSEDPGNLSRRQYADILAYILSVNEFPGGQKELESETAPLNDIRIEAKRR